jgi:mRNA-degrading endonuclease toxin of MazEF toxin-antitoxin module
MAGERDGAFERREIWFANHSPTEGREQRGDRPTLIVSDSRFNQSGSRLVIACPLTTTDRGLASHVHVPAGRGGQGQLRHLRGHSLDVQAAIRTSTWELFRVR